MRSDETNAPASNAPSPDTGLEVKTIVDPSIQADNAEQEKTLSTADMPNGLSDALVAMLQLPQEIKPSVVKETLTNTTVSGMADAVTTAREITDSMAITHRMAGIAVASEAGANKTRANQPATNAGIIQTGAKHGMTTASSAKADAAIMLAANTDKSALYNGSGPDISRSAELPGNLQDAARSAQSIAQSAASMAGSGILHNVLANDKTASNQQTISSPLNSNGWAGEFSQKITWMGTQQNQVAELHLNPPNLGPLDVVLKISDNQATALFTSPHSAVRDAVENALPKLREMLADNGIMLGNTMVSDQSPRDRSADGLIDHGAGAPARHENSDDAPRVAGLSLATTQAITTRQHNGMVDTFA
ncbi:MAG: flagellar hook-length control protein FliK [Gallionella sp.]